MEPKVCVFAMIGLPAAGKTTFCRWLLESTQSSYNIIHICYDEIFDFPKFSKHEPETSELYIYKAQRIEILKIIEGITKAVANSQEIPAHLKEKITISTNNEPTRQYIILCDDNHYYRSMRYKVYQLCKVQNYVYAQIYFECSQQLALERNAQRIFDCQLPENVIDQMVERLEVPDLNSWEKFTLTVQAQDFNLSVDDVFLLAGRALESIVFLTQIDNKVYKKPSLLHKLDVKLRRRIAEILITIENKEGKQLKAYHLNKERKKILQKSREIFDLDETKIDEFVYLLN